MNNNKYCKFCHTGNPSDANWCRNCGGLFPEDETRHEKLNKNQSANKAPVRKKTGNKKKKRWLLLLIPVVLFGLFCLISYICVPELKIFKSSIELSPEGGSKKIYLDSHGRNYWAHEGQHWMEITSEAPDGFEIKYESNDSGRIRHGSIEISVYNWAGGRTYTIYVNQDPITYRIN